MRIETCRRVFPVVVFIVPVLGVGVPARGQALFTVNTTVDLTDANPGDGVCDAGAGVGICTLRAAIQEANARAGADTIIVPPAPTR